jgi:excisionase family DNA binding protein
MGRLGNSNCGDMLVNAEDLEPLLVTIPDARRLIGIGTTKLYALINEGHLEVVKIGQRTLVRYESLKRLASNGC